MALGGTAIPGCVGCRTLRLSGCGFSPFVSASPGSVLLLAFSPPSLPLYFITSLFPPRHPTSGSFPVVIVVVTSSVLQIHHCHLVVSAHRHERPRPIRLHQNSFPRSSPDSAASLPSAKPHPQSPRSPVPLSEISTSFPVRRKLQAGSSATSSHPPSASPSSTPNR